MAVITLTTQPIALSPETVDALIRRGSGDAALLYLYLLRTGGTYSSRAAQDALGWNAARAMSAMNHLIELGLAEDDTPPERKNAPRPEDCPNYSTDDITSELKTQGSQFKALLEEVEHLLGKTLSLTETRTLLELYDHLAMPAEVLLLITARKIEEIQRQFGPGRRPRMSEIKAMAYQWKKQGIDSLAAAEERIRRLDYLQSQEGALLQAVGIANRTPLSAEQRYLHQWLEWGFGPEGVRMAYERTVLRKGSMNWGYCNGILRRWHAKNAHTGTEIDAAERPAPKAPAPKAPASPTATPSTARKNAEWMRKMLEEE